MPRRVRRSGRSLEGRVDGGPADCRRGFNITIITAESAPESKPSLDSASILVVR
jgi:hypothetical protein